VTRPAPPTRKRRAAAGGGTPGSAAASSPAERALDVLSILLSDVRYGLGAYLGVYLITEHAWDAESVGVALSIGGWSACCRRRRSG
jgi:hypothetical protein